MSSGFGSFSDGNRNIVDFLLHTLSLFTHTIKCLSINKAIFSKIDLGTPGTSLFSIFRYFCGGHGGCSFQALLLVSCSGGGSFQALLLVSRGGGGEALLLVSRGGGGEALLLVSRGGGGSSHT